MLFEASVRFDSATGATRPHVVRRYVIEAGDKLQAAGKIARYLRETRPTREARGWCGGMVMLVEPARG